MSDPRQWAFVSDMNYSGSVTISDVWLWIEWLYFFPGDGAIYFLVNTGQSVGQFFEITYSDYGGILSGIISFVVWATALVVWGVVASLLDD